VHFTKQVRFLTNLCVVIAIKNHVTKLLRGYDIDSNLSVRVLMVTFKTLGVFGNILEDIDSIFDKILSLSIPPSTRTLIFPKP
jgi:hypothetical protein